jgi:hypothetical protein
MTTAIWKYTLHAEDVQNVAMPTGARILSVEEQGGEIVMYALVNVNGDEEMRTVWTLGTGHPASHLPEDAPFVGTVKLRGGLLMFHVFAK